MGPAVRKSSAILNWDRIAREGNVFHLREVRLANQLSLLSRRTGSETSSRDFHDFRCTRRAHIAC
jgi:hypothetical protein